MNTLEFLIEHYGLRLNTADLATVFDTTPSEIRNRISEEVFPVPTYKDLPSKQAPRFADVRDVAEYLDKKRSTASVQVSPGQGGYSVLKTSSRSARRRKRPPQSKDLSQTDGK